VISQKAVFEAFATTRQIGESTSCSYRSFAATDNRAEARRPDVGLFFNEEEPVLLTAKP
jgi:hypothetical protein